VLRQFLALLIFVSSASIAVHAQAGPTAERVAAVQVGGGLTIVRPDYEPNTIMGYAFYGDYDFTSHFGIEGDIHIANLITPSDISESSYVLGPRYVFNKGRFHPYGKALLGLGVFTFQAVNGLPASSSTHRMYAFGGGLDIAVKRRWNVRAFDMEYQQWPGFTANGLTPIAFTVGAAYNLF
jgi:hypothetical protein